MVAETGASIYTICATPPGERNDLAEKAPARVAAMLARLQAWRQETGARHLRQKDDGTKPWSP